MKRPPVLVLNLTLAALALFSLLGTLVTVTWLFGAAWMLGPRLSHATPGPDPAVLAGPTSPMTASEVPPGAPDPLAGTSKVSARWQVAKPIRHEQVAIYPILDSKPPLETGVHVLLKDALARGTRRGTARRWGSSGAPGRDRPLDQSGRARG